LRRGVRLDQFGTKVREVLSLLLEKYEQHGTAQFVLPDVLQLPPINGFGNVMEIVELFGGPDQLRNIVKEIQAALYAA
jgi:type I restriction enzyme, R subunit